ncbi:MAG TPA: WYL domain-containing protein [Tenuifilaceae bacterium]|nr:WYL domain-containing protein [Tenuifilaceae bacterium]HPW26585.1 WYL domain-containing protein [Tenuifilaceae bacterium]
MVEHKKLYRIFQLISRLRSPFGATKGALARDFDVSERTIERYFSLLRDLGFVIEKEGDRFKIPRIDKGQLTPENLIVFSLEEAAFIRDAILTSTPHSPVQKSIVSKLYALTDMDDISDTIYRQSVSKSIGTLREAMRERKQVVLKSYQSVSGGDVRDRLVEPIKFFSYYVYLLAFDAEVEEVRQFKIDRMGSVELTHTPWKYEGQHGSQRIDHFGMSGSTPIPVRLQLSNLAHKLMVEEFPDTGLSIKTGGEAILYEGMVYSFEGIGRFIMGLLNEVRIIEPKELQTYVVEKVKIWFKGQ